MASRILVGAGLVLMSAAGAAQTAAKQRCPNCSARVVLSARKAEDFAKVLRILSSMPLSGEVIARNADAKTATLLVTTDPLYAQRNGLDSFDVAKRLLAFAKDYEIREIRAVVKTAGHR